MYGIVDVLNLINYLCNIGLRKPVWFMPERHIVLPISVKSNHSIKACSVQKQEVQWVPMFIKPVPYEVIMFLALFR